MNYYILAIATIISKPYKLLLLLDRPLILNSDSSIKMARSDISKLGENRFSMILIASFNFDDEGKDYFDRIRLNIKRMGMLIDELLRLSRVSRSEMRYSKADLSTLVAE